MRFSLQTRYAVSGVFDLAYNGHGAAVQVRVIGERQAIPMRYLEQIFQRLRKAGLVAGKRGPGGGYTLARPAAEISLRDIVEAVEGPILLFAEVAAADRGQRKGSQGVAETAGAAGEGGLRPGAGDPEASTRGAGPDFIWEEVGQQLAAVLEQTTIDDLCRRAARRAVPRTQIDGYEYQI